MMINYNEQYNVYTSSEKLSDFIEFKNFFYSINFLDERLKDCFNIRKIKLFFLTNNKKIILHDSITNTWIFFGEDRKLPINVGFFNNDDFSWTNDFRIAYRLHPYIYDIKSITEKINLYNVGATLEYVPMQNIYTLTSKFLLNGKDFNVISSLEVEDYIEHADNFTKRMINCT